MKKIFVLAAVAALASLAACTKEAPVDENAVSVNATDIPTDAVVVDVPADESEAANSK